MLTPQDMIAKLAGVPKGASVFVSYQAGRRPTERAMREAKRASNEGYPRRWLQGRLENVWVTKKGEAVASIFTYTRYNENEPGGGDGHYRTINPALGTLHGLEVL